MSTIFSTLTSRQWKLVFAAITVAAASGAMVHGAAADEIQVNIEGDQPGGTVVALTGATNGAPGGDFPIWDNTDTANGTVTNLMQVSNTNSGAQVTFTSDGSYSTVSNVSSAYANNNEILLYQWNFEQHSTTTPVSAAVSNLPSTYTDYDVYVYLESNANTPASVTISGNVTLPTYYYEAENTSVGANDNSSDFVAATDTTGYVSGGAPEADYVEFTGLTGPSFTIDDYVRTMGSNAAISGFQIVQVPEPASLACLGIGMAGLLPRRRRIFPAS